MHLVEMRMWNFLIRSIHLNFSRMYVCIYVCVCVCLSVGSANEYKYFSFSVRKFQEGRQHDDEWNNNNKLPAKHRRKIVWQNVKYWITLSKMATYYSSYACLCVCVSVVYIYIDLLSWVSVRECVCVCMLFFRLTRKTVIYFHLFGASEYDEFFRRTGSNVLDISLIFLLYIARRKAIRDDTFTGNADNYMRAFATKILRSIISRTTFIKKIQSNQLQIHN